MVHQRFILYIKSLKHKLGLTVVQRSTLELKLWCQKVKYFYSLACDCAPVPMNAGHLPGLVAHLNVPEGTVLTIKAVPGPFLLD